MLRIDNFIGTELCTVTTSARCKLRADIYTFLDADPSTNKDFLSETPSASSTAVNDFVFGVSKSKSSTTVKDLFLAFKLKADLRANRLTFLFTF